MNIDPNSKRIILMDRPRSKPDQKFNAGFGEFAHKGKVGTASGWEKKYLRGESWKVPMARDMLVFLAIEFEEKHREIDDHIWELRAAGYDFPDVERILRNKYGELKEEILRDRHERYARIQAGDETVIPQTEGEASIMKAVRETKEMQKRGEISVQAAQAAAAEAEKEVERVRASGAAKFAKIDALLAELTELGRQMDALSEKDNAENELENLHRHHAVVYAQLEKEMGTEEESRAGDSSSSEQSSSEEEWKNDEWDFSAAVYRQSSRIIREEIMKQEEIRKNTAEQMAKINGDLQAVKQKEEAFWKQCREERRMIELEMEARKKRPWGKKIYAFFFGESSGK
ncbi:MAG: hypothetical protein LBI69_03650 [Puniceicoccales bacterium]|jgi:hypothetical protein|nr:hypothetical protein [Puniceicoccales bacterium]